MRTPVPLNAGRVRTSRAAGTSNGRCQFDIPFRARAPTTSSHHVLKGRARTYGSSSTCGACCIRAQLYSIYYLFIYNLQANRNIPLHWHRTQTTGVDQETAVLKTRTPFSFRLEATNDPPSNGRSRESFKKGEEKSRENRHRHRPYPTNRPGRTAAAHEKETKINGTLRQFHSNSNPNKIPVQTSRSCFAEIHPSPASSPRNPGRIYPSSQLVVAAPSKYRIESWDDEPNRGQITFSYPWPSRTNRHSLPPLTLRHPIPDLRAP